MDDDPSTRRIYAAFLTEMGLAGVTTAGGAAECLAAVEAALLPFDCVLVDIQMPDLSGIEVVRRLRARPGYERTPILMITAARTPECVVKDAFDAGADGFCLQTDLAQGIA
ncbi:response regulator [Citreimonas salinaria]|uniref:response regulator n=1 Tax=Citreimonas salinaria TaxID=321339 RepID=UPI0015A5EA3F|nr:response regulator [Citreimonas salinaria]